jgi:predicted methyltransferase
VLLSARDNGQQFVYESVDLGISKVEIELSSDHVLLPDDQRLDWAQLREIGGNELSCYLVRDSQIEKIHFFSQMFNRYYSLMPTRRAPTMLISGIPMHRIKKTDPYQDTLSKVKAVAPLSGRVLDTTMGLGYTAVEAAKMAEHVTTIELDPTVEAVCQHNPWSQGLFDNPQITRLIGDTYDLIRDFEDGTFTRIVHDPPMFNLAGELYSLDFYRQLLRVLRGSGRIFHYVGNPASKSGRGITRGVVRRLHEAGFGRVKPYPKAFGVVANK